MGIYVNPGNRGFEEINDADYVDKTLLIDLIAYNREEKTGKRKHTCKILELQAL